MNAIPRSEIFSRGFLRVPERGVFVFTFMGSPTRKNSNSFAVPIFETYSPSTTVNQLTT
jgi:hypothetical protein